jgi:hypothetical protein
LSEEHPFQSVLYVLKSSLDELRIGTLSTNAAATTATAAR